jgi:hypothetical protein
LRRRQGDRSRKLQNTLEDIKTNLEASETRNATVSQPVVAPPGRSRDLGLDVAQSAGGPLSTAALVVTMVIFMLLERRDLAIG